MSEEELVQQARAGDTHAFEQLVLDNQNRIYTLALRMTGSSEDALDLAQESFLRAWRSLDQFQGNSSFSTWLYRLSTNLCLDFLRRQKRLLEVEGGPSLDDEEASIPQPADRSSDPQQALERKEIRLAVERGLEALPHHHRQVLVMRELSGLSYQEISEILQLDPGTVKSRISRARQALKKNLIAMGNLFGVPSSNPKKNQGGDPA